MRGLAWLLGDLLASAGDDRVIRIWRTATGEPWRAPLDGHRGRVRRLATNPDGQLLASGGLDLTVRLWDTQTMTPHGEPLAGHDDEIENP